MPGKEPWAAVGKPALCTFCVTWHKPRLDLHGTADPRDLEGSRRGQGLCPSCSCLLQAASRDGGRLGPNCFFRGEFQETPPGEHWLSSVHVLSPQVILWVTATERTSQWRPNPIQIGFRFMFLILHMTQILCFNLSLLLTIVSSPTFFESNKLVVSL